MGNVGSLAPGLDCSSGNAADCPTAAKDIAYFTHELKIDYLKVDGMSVCLLILLSRGFSCMFVRRCRHSLLYVPQPTREGYITTPAKGATAVASMCVPTTKVIRSSHACSTRWVLQRDMVPILPRGGSP